MDKVEYCHIRDYTLSKLSLIGPGNNNGFYIGSAQNHKFIIDKKVTDIKNKRATNTNNILEGLKVIEITERFYYFLLKNKNFIYEN